MTEPKRTAPRRSPAMFAVALVLPVGLLVYAVAFFASIHGLRLDSRAYPQTLIVVLTLLLLSQIAGDARAWWRGEEGERGPRELWARWHRTAYTVGLTGAFAFAIERVGFYEAMIPYVVVLLPAIGVRRPLYVALFTAGSVVVVYGLFTVLLGVRLPKGSLGL
jgi:hypothetical protein